MANPRKPTALKLVQGNPGKRALNPAEPKPARALPSPPDHISIRARNAWGRVATMLDRMGVLTEADGLALERLCECYADILEARESLALPIEVEERDPRDRRDVDGLPVMVTRQVAEGGSLTYITYGKSGPMLRSRPELALIADADRRFRGYLSDFGLTPAARSKVSATDPGAAADPRASYFG